MLTDEQLTGNLLTQYRRIQEMDDESFAMLRVAACDEINRSMDEDDLVGELRGRYYQAMCDAVARRR